MILGSAKETKRSEESLSFLVLSSLVPDLRRELKDPPCRPSGKQREDFADVGPGLDAVELAARDERDGSRVPVRTIVASAKRPSYDAPRPRAGVRPPRRCCRASTVRPRGSARASRWL